MHYIFLFHKYNTRRNECINNGTNGNGNNGNGNNGRCHRIPCNCRAKHEIAAGPTHESNVTND